MFSNSAKKDLQKFQYCFCKKKKLSVQRERVKKKLSGKVQGLTSATFHCHWKCKRNGEAKL